jgi:hypothetical protein
VTLGIAWVRTFRKTRELVIASDSRLGGGQFWDANPKIMLLPRTDCAISFAGSTFDAYPLMLQAFNTIAMFDIAKNRAMDITQLKGHLIRIFNHSRSYISNPPVGQAEPDDPDAIFILGGYSWRKRQFEIWLLRYDKVSRKFIFHTISPGITEEGTGNRIAFVGDAEVVKAAKRRLVALTFARYGYFKKMPFDMEPFEVLRDMLRSKEYSSIGGPPQLVKIYEHMNATPFGVYWPTKVSGEATMLGRPLLSYEKPSWGVLDPDSPSARPQRM